MLYQLSVINGHIEACPDGTLKFDLYIQPDEAECRHLLEDFKIDAHTLQSAQDPEETPRIEFERDHTAVIMKCPQLHSGDGNFTFRVNSVGIFLFSSDHVIVVANEKWPFSRVPGSRDGRTAEYLSTIQDFLLRMLSQSIRFFEIKLRDISERREQMKEKMSRSPKNEYLMQMFNLREGLVYYADALRGNGHLLERFRAASQKLGFTQKNLELLEDYAIENQQFLEQAQVCSQVLTEMMDTCSAIINNDLNVTMKNMNCLVIAISIPTFFTGLGGMSEFTTFVAPCMEWYVSYPLFFLIMLILSALVYRLVRRYYRD